MNIEYPSVTETGTAAIEQIKSYLFRLSEQLNYELSSIKSGVAEVKTVQTAMEQAVSASDTKTKQEQFNALKSLIINSGEIIEAYADAITKTLEGKYVIESTFGEYVETTAQTLTETSTAIDRNFQNIQRISSELVEGTYGDETYLVVDARIRTGYLYDDEGTPVYGVEIGQYTDIDGTNVFSGYARFTSNRLSFLREGIELAYFSRDSLYITNAVITGTMKIGGYKIDTTSGIVFNWVG